MYRVELGSELGFLGIKLPSLPSPADVVGGLKSGFNTVVGVGKKLVGVADSDVFKDARSDFEDVLTFVGGKPVQPLSPVSPLPPILVPIPEPFQTRTSLIDEARARNREAAAAKSATLPLLIGAGVLGAFLLLRK